MNNKIHGMPMSIASRPANDAPVYGYNARVEIGGGKNALQNREMSFSTGFFFRVHTSRMDYDPD